MGMLSPFLQIFHPHDAACHMTRSHDMWPANTPAASTAYPFPFFFFPSHHCPHTSPLHCTRAYSERHMEAIAAWIWTMDKTASPPPTMGSAASQSVTGLDTVQALLAVASSLHYEHTVTWDDHHSRFRLSRDRISPVTHNNNHCRQHVTSSGPQRLGR